MKDEKLTILNIQNFEIMDWLPHEKYLTFIKKVQYPLLVQGGRNLLEELQWNQLLTDAQQ